MSHVGYNRKFWATSDYVRSSPKTGHWKRNVCFSTENVRLTPNSRHSRDLGWTSAYDPKALLRPLHPFRSRSRGSAEIYRTRCFRPGRRDGARTWARGALQRAMVAARAKPLYEAEAKARMAEGGRKKGRQIWVVGQFEIYFSRSLKVAMSLGLSSGRTVARRFPGFVGPSISGPPQTFSAACSLSSASTLREPSSDFPPV